MALMSFNRKKTRPQMEDSSTMPNAIFAFLFRALAGCFGNLTFAECPRIRMATASKIQTTMVLDPRVLLGHRVLQDRVPRAIALAPAPALVRLLAAILAMGRARMKIAKGAKSAPRAHVK